MPISRKIYAKVLRRFYDTLFPPSERVEFHGDPRAISFGSSVYKLRGKEKQGLVILLWDRRKEIGFDKSVVLQGELVSKGFVAVQLGLEGSSQKLSEKTKQRVKSIIGELNYEFKSHGFPMRINGRGAIQLIVSYDTLPGGWEKEWKRYLDWQEEHAKELDKLQEQLKKTSPA